MDEEKLLSEEELLLLNNLIYLPEFYNDKNKGLTVSEILKRTITPTNNQQAMSETEWQAVIDLVKSNETLLDLKISDINYDEDTGEKMACFYNPKTDEAVAVFAGTGYNEWYDNAQGGYLPDTKQQQNALKWFESLKFDNITVTGHSKGGNKAAYVFVLSNKGLRCVGFDGQGESPEFFKKYGDLVKEKQEKITMISNYRDYVNILC